MTTARSICGVGILIAVCGSLLTAPLAAQGDEKARAARRGKVLYDLYCHTCHGREARGDGPLAEYLEVRPANLRELSQRVGDLSDAWLARVIDGRDEVGAHGTREMPVWGIGFYDPALSGDQEKAIQGRIRDLVEYVLSIQQKP